MSASSLARIPGPLRRVLFRFLSESRRISLFPLGRTGEDIKLTGWPDFGSEPFLVKLGSHVTISSGVRFTNHDGATRVIRDRVPGLHLYDEIVVGDSVFIGMGTLVLPGVHIGDRCIIGAGSVVTRDIPSNCVAAGVPCRVLCTIEDYESRAVARGMIWTGPYDDAWERAVLKHVAKCR